MYWNWKWTDWYRNKILIYDSFDYFIYLFIFQQNETKQIWEIVFDDIYRNRCKKQKNWFDTVWSKLKWMKIKE